MSGFLDSQPHFMQIESLYVAYFNRAADGPGEDYWTNFGGSVLTTVQAAQSLAVQPEAAALNIPTDHTDFNAVSTFIAAIYGNLFSHPADFAGFSYWHNQITSGAVSIGAAVVAIANGAQSSDAAVLGFKLSAAAYFSPETSVNGFGHTTPLDPTFLTNAHNAVAPVVDAATLAASKAATDQYAPPQIPAVEVVGHGVQQASGFLDSQAIYNQVESLYIGDFNRAADGPGAVYWTNPGSPTPVQIAQSFVVQPEAAALGIPTDHTDATAVAAFIQTIYGNLFSHTADAAGLAYWQGQITSGAVSLGAATYIIANGATGADATVLGLKIQAATYFTDRTFADNHGTTLPLDSTFLTNAHNAVAPVVDSATLQASKDATGLYARPGGPNIPPEQPAVALVGQSDTTHAMHHG